jgi:alpha-L-fucosidase
VFLHVFRAEAGRVELPALPRQVKSARLFTGQVVKADQAGGKLVLELPKAALDPIDTVVRLELDGSAMDIPAVSIASAGSIKASASNVFQKRTAQYGPQEAFDGEGDTRWATDAGTKQAWIVADLGKPQRVTGVRVDEALEERVRQFEFQYRQADAWKTIFVGQKIGPDFLRKFEAVTAQQFRLSILDATEGPTINEIELLTK